MLTAFTFYYYYLFHFIFVLKIVLSPKRRRVKNAMFHVLNILGMYTR